MRATIVLGIGIVLLLAAASVRADGGGVPTVVAEFDYLDTSGETRDQSTEHAARLREFAALLRRDLDAGGKYDVRDLDCPADPCSAGSMHPDELVQAARQAGARLLIYGGIHKMSTLIQWGKLQVVDLESDKLLLDRSFSFRGDDDRAYRRAAEFVLRYLHELEPKT